MTEQQKRRQNALLESLRYIANKSMSLDEMKLHCSKRELDYQEFLETRLLSVYKIAQDAVAKKKYLPLTSRS